MKNVKGWLYNSLGQRRYLSLVSKGYFLALRSGLLRKDSNYAWHYFAKNLIREGDHVLDIGANLGYFSVLFAEWVGPTGKVWSVEPMPLYRRVLANNLRNSPQAIIVPYALGKEAGTVEMGIPGSQPYRHGLTQILRPGQQKVVQTTKVKVRPPEELFQNFEQLDYIKCDVEGYEMEVLPQLETYFQQFQPLVQVEIGGKNRAPLFAFFKSLGYRVAGLNGENLYLLDSPESPCEGDVLFFPPSKENRLDPFFAT